MTAPVYDALRAFASQKPIRFFMPGHKGMPLQSCPQLSSFFPYDVTELPETDDLYRPHGFLQTAQEKAASLFGAEETIFLVNGSTAGVLAMLLGTLRDGDTVLVDRNCHQSVISGLILSGANPVYLMPQLHPASALPAQISPEQVQQALNRHPSARAVFLTSPNYYGICHPLSAIAEIVEKHGAALLVDEAHGAHFTLHPRFPQSALSAGAYACVQSLHKTLPAPNQTALLHLSRAAASAGDIRRALMCVQTTSPSFVLLALTDAMRSELQQHAPARYNALFSQLDQFYAATHSLRHIRVCRHTNADPSRIVLDFGYSTTDGLTAADFLKQEYRILPELANHRHMVCIATPDNAAEDFIALANGLSRLDDISAVRQPDSALSPHPPIFSPALRPRDAYFSPRRSVPVREAAGHICAEHIVCCPPCVPIASYGETITEETIDFLTKNNIQENISVI